MQGTILGYDNLKQCGVIRGDDGLRYNFVLTDWKSQGAPKEQDIVDFDKVEKNASEIYLLKRTQSFSDNAKKIQLQVKQKLEEGHLKPQDLLTKFDYSKLIEIIKQYPFIILSALIIIGCFGPFFDIKEDFSLWGINSFISSYVDSINILSSWGMLENVNTFLIKIAPRFLYLFYLIPIFSFLVLFKEIKKTSTNKNRIILGLSGALIPIVSFLLFIIFTFLSVSGDNKQILSGLFQQGSSNNDFGLIDCIGVLGWGYYFILVPSILILLISFNVIQLNMNKLNQSVSDTRLNEINP